MGTDHDQAKLQELDAYIASLNLAGKDTEGRRAVLIQVLHKAQELFSYLPEDVQKHVAAALGLHLSEVYGVISFYHLFKTKLSGKYSVEFCMGTACYVRGVGKLIEKVEQALGVKLGETTKDGLFTLGQLRCVGACSLAPVIQIGGRTFGRVTEDQIPGILNEFK